MSGMFLDRNQIYRLLQRESPEDVYVDGDPASSFTGADYYASASAGEQAYSNLQKSYLNIFPLTVDENIEDWEKMVFDRPQPVLPTLQERRDRVIQKLRRLRGISAWDIATLVAGYLPEGTWVQIIERGCHKGSWFLGKSKLSSETYLADGNKIYSRTALCDRKNRKAWLLSKCKLGVNTHLGNHRVERAFRRAYMYDVRIYDYTLPQDQLLQLFLDLTRYEPARSIHRVYQGLDLSSSPFQTEVPNVGQFNNILLITRDSTSTTGYKGRVA